MNDKNIKLSYIFGGLSFIPLIGVLFGLISFIIGLIKFKYRGWILSLIGLGGIIFTIIIYSSLFYFGLKHRGGIYDELREKTVIMNLNVIVRNMEYFKNQNKKYPQSLTEYKKYFESKKDPMNNINDPIQTIMKNQEGLYYYELFNDNKNYLLFSKGIDGLSFTSDDIYPEINREELKNIGFNFKK